MPMTVPPVPGASDVTDQQWTLFFEIIRRICNTPPYYAQSTDPGILGVPTGTWSIWKNTTSGVVKLWVNDGGVMKSVTIT